MDSRITYCALCGKKFDHTSRRRYFNHFCARSPLSSSTPDNSDLKALGVNNVGKERYIE